LWRVWTTNDAKRGGRRKRVSCFSWPFARFVIQALVYELYGLTEEEIAVVEGVRTRRTKGEANE